jgi:hypothetical protein
MITNRELDAIGPRGSAPYAEPAAPPAPGREPYVVVPPARGESDEYELVRDAPSPRGSWALRCRRTGRTAWSMPLAPRGAAPGVRPAVAQAVAVRVLGELGVFVSGWNQLDDDAPGHVDDAWRFVARRPRAASALV